MTIRDLADGQLVLVRATIVSVYSHDVLIEIATDLFGGRRRVNSPMSEIIIPTSVDAAYEATRVMAQKVDGLRDIVARVQAEVGELGAITGTGKAGLCGCGLVTPR